MLVEEPQEWQKVIFPEISPLMFSLLEKMHFLPKLGSPLRNDLISTYEEQGYILELGNIMANWGHILENLEMAS